MIKAGMTVTEAIGQLTKGFIKMMGRNPDGLEKIKIKQEAIEKLKNLEKVVDLEGNVIDTSKGIIGGRQIQDSPEFGAKIKETYDAAKGPGKGQEMVDALKSPGAKKSYEILEKQLGVKLYGDETFEEVMEIQRTGKHPRGEPKADGGRAGFSNGGIDILKAEDKAFKNAIDAFKYYQKMGGKKNFKDYLKEAGRFGDQFRAEGGRIGYKIGGIDLARRAFLKAAAGVGAGIGALKTGLLSIGKSGDAVKNLPPIKTPVTKLEGTTTEMPEWFPSFINKFREEGKATNVFKQKKVEVTKAEYDKAIAEGKGENYYTDVARTPEYKANNPDHMDYFKLENTDERIYTTYTNDKVPGVRVDDMDGNVDVMFENEYSQPVSLNYTAPGKRGPETGRVDEFVQGEAKMETKPKGEFVANDVEVYATDPDGGSESVDVIANTVDDMLEGTTRQMEEYATGKKTKMSSGEFRVGQAEARAEQAAEEAAEAADDFASGGIARMLGE